MLTFAFHNKLEKIEFLKNTKCFEIFFNLKKFADWLSGDTVRLTNRYDDGEVEHFAIARDLRSNRPHFGCRFRRP